MAFPTRLLDGYQAFARGRLRAEQRRYQELAENGQRPETMVIGCCDSRVSPEVIFDAGPGELFVVRNVANLVPPYQPDGGQHGISAALEFGVQVLRVKNIVVLGHAQCGGVRAFAENADPLSPGDFIGKWISLLQPAADSLGERKCDSLLQYIRRLEFASLEQSLKNLMTFPCIRILAERGKLQLHAAYFDVASGQLSVRDRQAGAFCAVTADGLQAT